jgi:hypothetical protein
MVIEMKVKIIFWFVKFFFSLNIIYYHLIVLQLNFINLYFRFLLIRMRFNLKLINHFSFFFLILLNKIFYLVIYL